MYRNTLTVLLILISTAASAVDESLEPYLNGDVSQIGNFSGQLMEDQIDAYIKRASAKTYHLFGVAHRNIIPSFPN